ncbi:hypothetical protein [Rhodococcus sovatensis]|uniref:Uncharacterized protein n=1 Tax=Rhodococcus sovatensis TaxID=1805840 RepID=A0ABZ2PJ45_9NOCA
MSVPLTLGVPHRPEPQALVAGLLHQRCRNIDELNGRHSALTAGPPVVAASVLAALPSGIDLGRIVVDLDIDPAELSGGAATYEVARFHIDVDADTVEEATRLRLPSPLVIFPELTDASLMDLVTVIVDAHRTPGFAASASPRHIADILAVVAHADVGVCARAGNGQDVLAVLSATVAALRGDDIQTALSDPNLGSLARLRPEAAEALRTVLLGIEIDDAASAHRELVAAQLVRPFSPDGPPPTT